MEAWILCYITIHDTHYITYFVINHNMIINNNNSKKNNINLNCNLGVTQCIKAALVETVMLLHRIRFDWSVTLLFVAREIAALSARGYRPKLVNMWSRLIKNDKQSIKQTISLKMDQMSLVREVVAACHTIPLKCHIWTDLDNRRNWFNVIMSYVVTLLCIC